MSQFAELFAIQQQLADAVRDSAKAAPVGVKPEALAVYQDLVFNNIAGFIRSTFPVLRQICTDVVFDRYIRQFMQQHRLDSPYFVDIPAAFLAWLPTQLGTHETALPALPGFCLELAHYEWLELDVFRRADPVGEPIDEEVNPMMEATQAETLLSEPIPSAPVPSQVMLSQVMSQVTLSRTPSIRLLTVLDVAAYRYPVHQLSPSFQPSSPPAEPTYLALYRDRVTHLARSSAPISVQTQPQHISQHHGQVRFLQLTPLSAATVQLLLQGHRSEADVLQQLQQLAPQLPGTTLRDGLQALLAQLQQLGILTWQH